jgi:hypothetical protein
VLLRALELLDSSMPDFAQPKAIRSRGSQGFMVKRVRTEVRKFASDANLDLPLGCVASRDAGALISSP